MKWLGQHIVDLIARFRGDVYLEDVETGTIKDGGNLGLDSNNKIVQADVPTGDITGVALGTDSLGLAVNSGDVAWTIAGGSGITTSASGGDTITIDADAASTSARGVVELATTAETTTGTATGTAVTPDGLKDGYQGSTNVTTLGTISTGTWNGTAIASAYLDSDTAHLSGLQTFSGAKVFNSSIYAYGTVGPKIIVDEDNAIDPTTGGAAIHVDAFDVTDSNTGIGATTPLFSHVSIESPRLHATNNNVTTTKAATLHISNAPATGTNQTIGAAYALYINSGNAYIQDDLYLQGNLRLQYSTSYITFSALSTSSFGTNYVMIHAKGISESTFSSDSSVDSAGDFGGVTTEEGGSGTDATASVGSASLDQQIPIPEACRLIGFYATTSAYNTNVGAAYDTGVAIWHVPESGVNWGSSTASTATLIHKSDSSRHSENTAHSGTNRKKVQMVHRMDGTGKDLTAGDILIPSIFGETADQQIMATITLVIATPIKTIA